MNIPQGEWPVEVTAECEAWWDALTEGAKDAVAAVVLLLGARGPHLGVPYSSAVRGGRHGRLRELRIQHRGRPLRILYAFDPRRVALLLVGGDKTGGSRWYERHVPIADRLYQHHLRHLGKE